MTDKPMREDPTLARVELDAGLALGAVRGGLPVDPSVRERDHKDIAQWHAFDVGGHYAAHQTPEAPAKDIREFVVRLS